MKKLLILLCFLCIAFHHPVLADEQIQEKVVGTVYSSDIITYIDGMYVPSYNIGGETFVLVDDLAKCGFSIEKKQYQDSFDINLKQIEQPSIPPFEEPTYRQRYERPIGKLKSTNASVYINDMRVLQEAIFSFDGKIGVVLEKIATPGIEHLFSEEMYSLQALGYSNYLFSYVWNENDETLNIKTLYPGVKVPTNFGIFPVNHISFAWDNGWYGNCSLTEIKHTYDMPMDWMKEKYLKVIFTDNDDGYNRYFNLSELLTFFKKEYVIDDSLFTLKPSTKKNTYQLFDSENNVRHSFANWVHIELKGKNNVTADAIVQYGEVYILAADIEKFTGIKYRYDVIEKKSYFE